MNRFFCALAALVLIPLAATADELFPAAPTDEVVIRTIPACSSIEYETTGALGPAWVKGFQWGARYAAYAHSALNTPTIITFPDWEKTPDAAGPQVHLLIDTLLDPLPDFPTPHEEHLTLVPQPQITVACFAQTGPYSAENFLRGLHKIESFLQGRSIPETGPPRYLYYNNTAWWPTWWQVGEVQVPVPSRAGG